MKDFIIDIVTYIIVVTMMVFMLPELIIWMG